MNDFLSAKRKLAGQNGATEKGDWSLVRMLNIFWVLRVLRLFCNSNQLCMEYICHLPWKLHVPFRWLFHSYLLKFIKILSVHLRLCCKALVALDLSVQTSLHFVKPFQLNLIRTTNIPIEHGNWSTHFVGQHADLTYYNNDNTLTQIHTTIIHIR